jgi:ADP-ribose pyrophosphatase YjhB (NUDIX family)
MGIQLIQETGSLVKHLVSTGYIVNKEKTKMLMMWHNKLGKWACPGGHVEPNETPDQCAIRETYEETGVHVKLIDVTNHDLGTENIATNAQLPTPYAVIYELIPETKKEGAAHIHVDFIYVAEADETAPIVAQVAETESVKWFTRDEIMELDAFETNKNFAKEYLV